MLCPELEVRTQYSVSYKMHGSKSFFCSLVKVIIPVLQFHSVIYRIQIVFQHMLLYIYIRSNCSCLVSKSVHNGDRPYRYITQNKVHSKLHVVCVA